MEPLVAGIVAGLLALFELDRTFYLPRAWRHRIRISMWSYGFIIANGALAAAFDTAVRDAAVLQGLPWWLRGMSVGFGYLTIAHQKFTTLKSLPLGLELFYEEAKRFVYRRINDIAKPALAVETQALAGSKSLKQLASDARSHLQHDQLLTNEQKKRHRAWIAAVMRDNSEEEDKKLVLADYILSGRGPVSSS